MAGTPSQSLNLFTRDLKYMVDDRYSAAPLRRPAPRRVLAALAAFALALAAWSGTRLLQPADDIVAATVTLPERPPAAVEATAAQPPKYTQPEQAVSKVVDDPPAELDRHPIETPELESRIEWKSYAVRRGDTLGTIFQKFSIDVGLAGAIVKHETGQTLKKLLPGHNIHFGFNRENKLERLRYELNRMDELLIRFDDPDQFTVTKRKIPTVRQERSVSQTIGSSLFVSASKAGLSDRLIMQFVSIFGWDIDFARDIHSGDRFSILYEQMYRNGEFVGTGDVIAAEFVNTGDVYRAVRHIDEDGRKQYYDLDGRNLRGTFLRTPMKVSRITSGFSKARFHPVLKKWRAHRGVDYGAPTGTPILATADGRVHSLGRNGGYGKTIVLKHGGKYSTLYAHMSGYKSGLGNGSRVKQGDVIGYVGATGMVTGPHLHYEFRVNGVHHDPLTYETPKAESIPERYRDSFLVMARERISRITDVQVDQIASR